MSVVRTEGAKEIEPLEHGRVRLSGDVTLRELYESVPSRELRVEPLSESRPLAEFLAEGGLGFGSLRNGTFGGELLRVTSSYSDERGEVEFSYGLGTAPLYNTGYPLQRIIEGSKEGSTSDLIGGRFGRASEMVLRTRERRAVALEHSTSEAPELASADGAENVFFVNAAAAKAMDLPGAGIVKVSEADEPTGDDAWSKRFVLDALPEGHSKLLVLTQASGARELHVAHKAKHADGVFLALAVHLGVLVVASAPAGELEELAAKAAEIPLTWRLGA